MYLEHLLTKFIMTSENNHFNSHQKCTVKNSASIFHEKLNKLKEKQFLSMTKIPSL